MHNRIAADENFKWPILRGLERQFPGLLVINAQAHLPRGHPDDEVLRWAAETSCILLTHDSETIEAPAYSRVAKGLLMPGVIVVPWDFPIGRAIDQIALMLGAGRDGEWENTVVRLPLRF